MFPHEKKDGTTRTVHDFPWLNRAIKRKVHNVPNVDDITLNNMQKTRKCKETHKHRNAEILQMQRNSQMQKIRKSKETRKCRKPENAEKFENAETTQMSRNPQMQKCRNAETCKCRKHANAENMQMPRNMQMQKTCR